MLRRIPILLLLLLWPYVVAGQQREVRVASAQATVYDAPHPGAEVLGQLARGTSLRATGRTQGDWLEVEAPPQVSGWIFGELLRGDVVEASSVRIRSGAGVGFEGVGTLVKGDRIKRRGSQGGWVSFEGIPAMRIWIERSMVSAPATVDLTAAAPVATVPSAPPESVTPQVPSAVVPEGPATVPSPSRPPEPVVPARPPPAPSPTVPSPAPVVARPRLPVTPVPPPAAAPVMPGRGPVSEPPQPSSPLRPPMVAVRDRVASAEAAQALLPGGFRLVGSAPQGRAVRLEGVVRPVGWGLLRPAPYRLTTDREDVPRRTLAYLVTQDLSLAAHVDRSLRVTGYHFWLIGVREPVIVVTALD